MNCSNHRQVAAPSTPCLGIKSNGFSVTNMASQCSKVYYALYTKMFGFHLIRDDSLKFMLQPVKLTNAFKDPSANLRTSLDPVSNVI